MSKELQQMPTPTPPAVKAGKRGLVIKDFEQGIRFATAVYNSGIAPGGHKNAQSVFVAMQMGAELGLGPMTSIQTIAVINNRPCIWGDGLWAVCQASPVFDQDALKEQTSEDIREACCTVARVGGKPITRCFSMEDAKAAGLLNKDNWKKYPRRMLQMRARMWACRDAFPDLLCGISTVDEAVDDALGDTTAENTQQHIEQAKAAREAETTPASDRFHTVSEDPEPCPEAPTPEQQFKQAKAAREAAEPYPPFNPPTPKEVAEHKPVFPTPKQASNAETFCERIANAVTPANVEVLVANLIDAEEAQLITHEQARELAELLEAARARVG